MSATLPISPEASWLAVYTKPRWEKKVHARLQAKGIVSYCPLNVVHRQWSDRVKKVEEPLFRSYLFVCIPPSAQTEVRMTDGVLNFVYWNGKPAIVQPHEIETIRRFLNEYQEVEALPSLAPGQRVQIQSGLMMGATAIVEKIDNRWVEVSIESIGYRLRAKIDSRRLQRIP